MQLAISIFYFFCFAWFVCAFGDTTKHDADKQTSPQLSAILENKKSPPSYGSYILTATLELPLSDVFESVAVFFDQKMNRSRVDYQNGAVKTIQLGLNAGNKMLNFATTSAEAVSHRQQCYVLAGSDAHAIEPQPGIPGDLSRYSYIGETAMSGTRVSQWHLSQSKGTKKLNYDFYSHSVTNSPIRYEFTSFDTSLNAFVDKQIIEYSFSVEVTPSDTMFQIGEGLECQELLSFEQAKQMQRPELSSKEEMFLLMNPLSEFISVVKTDFITAKYENFKRVYKTQYASKVENEKRKAIFRHNVRFIESSNRAGLSFRLAVNHLADWTADELRTLRGFKRADWNLSTQAVEFNKSKYNLRGLEKLPNSVSLWLLGAVSSVGDQKLCGSDWAFAVSGAIEGALFLKFGRLINLSEQELVDCVISAGCDCGSHFQGYDWVKEHGLSTEQGYGPYLGRFSTCHFNATPAVATVKEWVQVKSNNTDDLRWAIAANGPVALAIDASHRSFTFYAGGIYAEPKCSQRGSKYNVDHSLVAVGYGTIAGRAYFLLKNSWSTDWGNTGYMLIDAAPEQSCGLLTEPTFAVV